MATSDLKGDFGGWLDASIIELGQIIEKIDAGEDFTTPREIYAARQQALILARCEFWDVVAR